MDFQAKVIVVFVWFIILFQGSCYLFLYIPLFASQSPLLCCLILPVFLFVYTLLCISYYKSIFCSPGHTNFHTNVHFNDELDDIKARARKQNQLKKVWRRNRQPGQINMDEINSLNSVSFCFKCQLVKQPRTHHCKICRKCIMRMDHHCPWVGNCVGRYNHKYFILFLFYATFDLTVVAATFTIDWLTGAHYQQQLTHPQTLIYYFSCITSWMLAFAIGFLFVTQMISSTLNVTTLESFTEGIWEKNPFDRYNGFENLREIFGTGNWFLPTNPFPHESALGNGSLDVL